MLGIITVAEVLDMSTPDDNGAGDCYTVRDTLDIKRQNPEYTDLLDSVRENGFELPIMIRTRNGQPWLADGHHRVAVAIDLGIDTLVWSDLPIEVEDHPFNPMMRGEWAPYRPAAA